MKVEKHGAFFKVDETAQIAYGWAIVCTENGQEYVDLQGDHIPEDVMVKAAIDFAANSRVGKDMHAGDRIGDCLFTYPITKNSAELGVPTAKTGLLIGFKPDDPAMLDLIKQGKRTGFSIGGFVTESVEEDIGKALLAKSAFAGAAAKTRRVFRSFKINEISLVDVPAMEGATVGYVKSGTRVIASRSDRVAKSSLYTNEVDGHQHSICVYDDGSMWVAHATSAGAEYSHSHGIVFEGGVLTILADSGHSHELAEGLAGVVAVPADAIVVVQASASSTTNRDTAAAHASKSTRTAPIAQAASYTENTQMPTEQDKQIADLTKRNERLDRIAKLSGAHKSHFDTLSADDADAFLAKSTADRESIVQKALEDDKPIWTGEVTKVAVRKRDGELALQLAKQNEHQAVQLAKQAEDIEKAAVRKLAAEVLGDSAGGDEVHDYVVLCVRKGGDAALTEKALTAMRGWNALAKGAGVAKGVNPGSDPAPSSARVALKTAVNEYAKANGGIQYEAALVKAIKSDAKIRELYEQVRNEN